MFLGTVPIDLLCLQISHAEAIAIPVINEHSQTKSLSNMKFHHSKTLILESRERWVFLLLILALLSNKNNLYYNR